MTFEEARRNDQTVNSLLRQGGDYEDIIAALATEKEMMIRHIEGLEAIAPKRYRFPDGRVLVWRCPEDMIPIIEPTEP